MLFEGMLVPLTTPFFGDGRLNLHKLATNVERYSKTPAAGIVALSETGEAALLSDAETEQVLRAVPKPAAPERVLIAGISRQSVAGTVALAEKAAELGWDAVLVHAPVVEARDESRRLLEMLTYFRMVADRSPLPVVIGNARGRLAAATIIALSGHPQIVGAVEAGAEAIVELVRGTASVRRQVTVTQVFAAVTRRMQAATGAAGEAPSGLVSAESLAGGGGAAVATAPVAKAIRTRAKQVGFQVLSGSTAGMLAGLQAGASGTMAPFAACAPQACYEVFAAWKDDDQGLAAEKQARLVEAAEYVEGLEVGAIKFGCDLNGYFGGVARAPALPITGNQRFQIEEKMRGLRS